MGVALGSPVVANMRAEEVMGFTLDGRLTQAIHDEPSEKQGMYM